jgi:hypothetical protein
MSQHKFEISNSSGLALREDVQLAFKALVTQNAGSLPPAITYPFMTWPDMGSGLMMQRNSTDTEWLVKGILNSNGYPFWFRLNTALAGTNTNTAQNLLGAGVTLPVGTYEFEILFSLLKAAGTTAHTVAIGFGGTAVLSNIAYQLVYRSLDGGTFPPAALSPGFITWLQTATPTVISGSLTSASASHHGSIRGTVAISTPGTFTPQYLLSAAPGGAYTTGAASFMRIAPIQTRAADWS